MNIYVCDRGFVIVGEPAVRATNEWHMLGLNRCAVVRRWGTTKGLGELAEKGPQSGTVMDSEPDGTRINLLYVLREIPCSEKGWAKWKAS